MHEKKKLELNLVGNTCMMVNEEISEQTTSQNIFFSYMSNYLLQTKSFLQYKKQNQYTKIIGASCLPN